MDLLASWKSIIMLRDDIVLVNNHFNYLIYL